MKAIELSGLEGFKSLRVADVEKPKPEANQILIEVKAAGINFAELELTCGRYPALKPLPYVLGFEAAGIIAEIGSHVKNVQGEWLRPGQHITAVGADDATKCELDAQCFKRANRLIVDSRESASDHGEVRRWLKQGAITMEEVHGEIGDVLAGTVPGRRSEKRSR